jgi:hypothetical protein
LKDDWVYDENDNRLEIKSRAVEAYTNSDKNGKEYLVAKMFGYVQMLTQQLNQNTIEIHQLKQKIQELESEKK